MTSVRQLTPDRDSDPPTSARSEPNTVFWSRVRHRANLRWRYIAPEAGRNAFAAAALFGLLLIVIRGENSAQLPLTASPIGSANIIAIGALLAAVMSGVWVAIVSAAAPGSAVLQDPPSEAVLVRLHVFTVIARALSVATGMLAAATLVWYSGLPDHLDIARVVPIVGGWMLIAVIGADAATLASDPDGAGLNRFRKVAPLLRTEQALQQLALQPDQHTPRTALRDLRTKRQLLPFLAATILVPLITAAATAVLNPPTSEQMLGRLIIAICCSITAFLGWVLLSLLITNRDYIDAGMLAALASLFIFLIVVDVVASAAEQEPISTWPHLARIMLSVLLVTVPPLLIHGIGALPSRGRRGDGPYRNAVLTIVGVLLLHRHARQLRSVQPPTKLPVDRLAIVAFLLLPIPPVALLLANASAAKLRSDATVRGRTLAVTVRWIAAALLIAPIAVTVVLAAAP